MKRIMFCLCICLIFCGCSKTAIIKNKKKEMKNLTSMSIEEVKKYAEENKLDLKIEEEYSNEKKDKILKQSIEKGHCRPFVARFHAGCATG